MGGEKPLGAKPGSKLYIWRSREKATRAARERRCECEGRGKRGRALLFLRFYLARSLAPRFALHNWRADYMATLRKRENQQKNPHMASTPVFEPGPHWWDYCPTLALPKVEKLLWQSEDALNMKSTNQRSEPIHRAASYPVPPRDFRP